VYDDEGRLRYAASVGMGWDAMPFHPDFPPKKVALEQAFGQ